MITVTNSLTCMNRQLSGSGVIDSFIHLLLFEVNHSFPWPNNLFFTGERGGHSAEEDEHEGEAAGNKKRKRVFRPSATPRNSAGYFPQARQGGKTSSTPLGYGTSAEILSPCRRKSKDRQCVCLVRKRAIRTLPEETIIVR